ncbi:MAG: alpha-E domain-containing protein [Planctomycetota bacterium]
MLSRVADSLYWLGRYLERAEFAARLAEINLHLALDHSHDDQSERWSRMLAAVDCSADTAEDNGYPAIDALAFNPESSHSIATCIANARENARQVREQVTTEMFEQLNAMYFQVRKTRLADIWNAQPYRFFRDIRQGAYLFDGITEATLPHGEPYAFIHLGRALERTACTARLLDVYLADDLTDQADAFEAGHYLKCVALLRCCDAFEAYQDAYPEGVRADHIAEFLLFSQELPRSLRFAADRLHDALATIADRSGSTLAQPVTRLAGRLQAQLMYAQLNEVIDRGLHTFLTDVQAACDSIHHTNYRAFIAYPIQEMTA